MSQVDPEFLAELPPDVRQELLATLASQRRLQQQQQRQQRWPLSGKQQQQHHRMESRNSAHITGVGGGGTVARPTWKSHGDGSGGGRGGGRDRELDLEDGMQVGSLVVPLFCLII